MSLTLFEGHKILSHLRRLNRQTLALGKTIHSRFTDLLVNKKTKYYDKQQNDEKKERKMILEGRKKVQV
jgi:hypothetical protein